MYKLLLSYFSLVQGEVGYQYVTLNIEEYLPSVMKRKQYAEKNFHGTAFLALTHPLAGQPAPSQPHCPPPPARMLPEACADTAKAAAAGSEVPF